MPAFGFSVGDVIATIELIRKLLGGLKSTTGAAAQYQRTIIELESLQRVLRSVETLAADEHEDVSCIDSLRAAAFATSLTLGNFLLELSKYEGSLAPRNMNKVKRGAGALRWTMSMDEEVNRLQLYVAGQMLTINTLFRLLERENAKERDTQRRAEHQKVIGAINDQKNAISVVNRSVLPIKKNLREHNQTVRALAKDSITNTEILVRLQQRIIQSPSIPIGDSFRLNDALGRSFSLPYAYFNQWEMLESFIKQMFCARDIPGTHHVKSGRFFVSPSNHDSKVLTKANWPSNMYPGADLTMTIILGMLKMPVRQCPKPSCSQRVLDATEIGTFITCQACGLYFRFNPEIEHLGLNAEDDQLQLTHQGEDLSNFGRRYVPQDVVNVRPEDERQREGASLLAAFLPVAEMEPKEPTAQTLTSGALAALEVLSSKENSNGKFQLAALDSPQLPSVDWNSGTSGMAAWLNSSAAPAHEGEAPGLKSDTFHAETEQLQQEEKDIESFTRVHFVSTVPQSQPLKEIVEEYQEMPLEAQIYVRKIVDRFPIVPSFLAKRFANANATRLSRLQQKNENTEDKGPSPSPLQGKSWNSKRRSAKPWLTTDCDDYHKYRMKCSNAIPAVSEGPKSRERASAESPGRQGRLSNPDLSVAHEWDQAEKFLNEAVELPKRWPNPPSETLDTPEGRTTTPKEAARWPQRARVKCSQRKEHPSGYRTEHESQRHIMRAHGKKQKAYICMDVSPDAKSLADCPDCQDGKTYNAYHRATAHLRKTHFDLPTKGKPKPGELRGRRAKTPMHILKDFIKEIEIDAVGNDVDASGPISVH